MLWFGFCFYFALKLTWWIQGLSPKAAWFLPFSIGGSNHSNYPGWFVFLGKRGHLKWKVKRFFSQHYFKPLGHFSLTSQVKERGGKNPNNKTTTNPQTILFLKPSSLEVMYRKSILAHLENAWGCTPFTRCFVDSRFLNGSITFPRWTKLEKPISNTVCLKPATPSHLPGPQDQRKDPALAGGK